jgi:hypothetical protein
MKLNKANTNYWVDLIIAIGFIFSAASGLVLFFSPSAGGYQGGRNLAYGEDFLLLSRHQWTTLHDWSSIVMISGGFLHLVLHWRWIKCMTKKLFRRSKPSQSAEVCANT